MEESGRYSRTHALTYSLHLLYQYTCTNTDAEGAGSFSSFANAIGDALGHNGITIPNNANTCKGKKASPTYGRDYARYLYGCMYVFM
jgi:hypothetical protein